MEYVIILLIALGLKALQVQFPLVVDQQFDRFRVWLCEGVIESKSATHQWVGVVGLAWLLIFALYSTLDEMLWGAGFVFSVIILVYSFGRSRLASQREQFLSSWQGKDIKNAYQQAFGFNDTDQSVVTLQQKARQKMAYQALEETISVLFWFLLFGPLGALFYRLSQLYLQQQDAGSDHYRLAEQLVNKLDWLPMQLLGLLFAVFGHFSGAMSAWVDGLTEWGESPASLLDRAVSQAIGRSLAWPQAEDQAAVLQTVEQEISDIYQLLNHCIIASIVLTIALLMVWA